MAEKEGRHKPPIRTQAFNPVNTLEVSITTPDPGDLDHNIQNTQDFTFVGTYNTPPPSGGSASFEAWIRPFDGTLAPLLPASITFPQANVWNANFTHPIATHTGRGTFYIRLTWTETNNGPKHCVHDVATINIV
jgi:hypothetical protein